MEHTSTNYLELFKAALKENLRIDSRKCLQYRPLKIQFFSDNDETCRHVRASLGSTLVSVSITAHIAQPFPDRPTEGMIHFKMSFLPHSFDKDQKNTEEEETHISRYLESAFKESRLIDSGSLCVLAGEQVWSLSIYVNVLNSDGNVLDCSSHAIIAALLHFRRPDTAIVDNADGTTSVKIFPSMEKTPIPLAIHYIPISISFAFFEEGEAHVVDPSAAEEFLAQGSLSLTIDSHSKSVCAMHKKGVALDLGAIQDCMNYAYVKAIDISNLIRSCMPK